MARILLALDKFKGCLSAAEVAEALAGGIADACPHAELMYCPIADGGEGTTAALVAARQGSWVKVQTVDALGLPLVAELGCCGEDVVMEMSAASGLALVSNRELQPQRASTYGTGQLLRAAAQLPGVERLVIGIGGSATNDGGSGMAAALGFRFLDAQGRELVELPADLCDLHAIELPKLTLPPVWVACDVTNPLLGPQGATRIYGPQKGVVDAGWFERRLERLADVAEKALGRHCRELPGAGAAGGLGWGLMTFLGAELKPGFDLVAEVTGLESRVREADIVITGEGCIDAQTLSGKGPAGVAALARSMGKRVVGFGGRVTDAARGSGLFDELYEVKPVGWTVEQSMRQAAEILRAAGSKWAGGLLH